MFNFQSGSGLGQGQGQQGHFGQQGLGTGQQGQPGSFGILTGKLGQQGMGQGIFGQPQQGQQVQDQQGQFGSSTGQLSQQGMGQSMFGQPQQGQPQQGQQGQIQQNFFSGTGTSSSFQGQPQQGQGQGLTSSFQAQQPQQTTSSTNIFSTNAPQTNLLTGQQIGTFLQYDPTKQNAPSMQQQSSNMGFTSQSMGMNMLAMPDLNKQPQNTIQIQQNKRDTDNIEVIGVIQNFLQAHDPNSHMNLFKYMLYNRVPVGNEQHVQALQVYNERATTDDGKQYVNEYDLWVKALQQNPNPRQFFPFQISSPDQLIHRIKTTEVFQYSAIETVLTLQNMQSSLNSQYDKDIEAKAMEVKSKHQFIKTKMLHVITKMEKLAQFCGKSERNYYLENVIANKLTSQRNYINENKDYLPKIKELTSQVSSMSFENSSGEDNDFFKDFDEVRLEKNINVLTDMKKIFDVTLNSLKKNSAVLNFIHSDLETLKKYGKIPK